MLYVGIVHAGVFGDADADRREVHLRFVVRQIRRAGFWLTSLGEMADWWQARERITLAVHDDRVVVANRGERAVGGLRLLVEHDGGTLVRAVPPLAAGAEAVLETRARHPRAAAG